MKYLLLFLIPLTSNAAIIDPHHYLRQLQKFLAPQDYHHAFEPGETVVIQNHGCRVFANQVTYQVFCSEESKNTETSVTEVRPDSILTQINESGRTYPSSLMRNAFEKSNGNYFVFDKMYFVDFYEIVLKNLEKIGDKMRLTYTWQHHAHEQAAVTYTETFQAHTTFLKQRVKRTVIAPDGHEFIWEEMLDKQ